MKNALVCSRSFGTVSEVWDEILKENGFRISRVPSEERPLNEEKMIKIFKESDPMIVICGAEPITRSVMAASPNLRMIMKHGVGVDNIDIDAATDLNVVIANAPGTNTESVADLTVSMMLALLRGVVQVATSTKNGGWERFIGHELGSLTVGVVGTGRIGYSVIQRLLGFGCQILAYDIIENESLAAEPNLNYCSLEELLKNADIVTLHAPLMPATREMIGAKELAMMKSSAYLINLARGELVDEKVLYKTLEQNGIAGAAVDVYAVEPPQSSPLLKLNNVIATSHIGAYTYEAMDRMDKVCVDTVNAILKGEVCPNVLNPQVMDQK